MTRIVGHDAQAEIFLDAMASGRMHHAWLLAGPAGIGKGLFARAAAARLLAGGTGPFQLPQDHPTARLVQARSHPDYQLLERARDEDGEQTGRNIPVDAVRRLQPLLTGTPSLSARRAIVIDAVDELERGGANALLKSLEEPPPGLVFLLVSHAPGRLLPTIRSRVRTLSFRPLGDADMRAALAQALPDEPAGSVDDLVAAGDGAPGSAIAAAGLDVAGLDRALHAIGSTGDPDRLGRLALVKALGGKTAQARYRVFLERVPATIAAVARQRQGTALARALAAWDEARSLCAAAVPLSLDVPSTVWKLGTIVAGLAGPVSAAKG
ncbi:DNA polymerase-3 subunit delta' [Sphingomonas jejuensis]|uniref:DNA polymerase-3 subunit delta n=1 Tax=Sphingomonas jejuensis TaxID=904715 RepID=A0ABX0XJH7_9SPHN|nr:DNA polymerase-3 subunit delta' [Sphingomonas jejuensis]